MMQVSIANTSELERVFTVTVPAADLTAAYDKVLKKIAKMAKVDGFRKGHVPQQMIQRLYGSSAFSEAVEKIVNENTPKALEEGKLKLAPNFGIDIKKAELGQDFVYDVVAEEFPKVNVVDLGSLEIEKLTCDVSDADVDNVIEKIRLQNGTFTPAEDDYQIGPNDKVKVKLTITQEGKDPIVNDNGVVVLFAAPKAVAEKYIGKKAGEKFDFTDESGEGDNKIVRKFDVEIKEVQKMNLPELNEAFFKSVGSKDQTLESFKTEVRNNIEREKNYLVLSKNAAAVREALLKAHEFAMPVKFIDKRVEEALEEAKKKAAASQKNAVNQLGKEYYQDLISSSYKYGFIVDAIIENNEIKVTEDDLKSKVQEIASAYEDADEVVKYYLSNPKIKNQIEDQCREQKVVDFVLSKANVKENKIDFNTLAAQAR